MTLFELLFILEQIESAGKGNYQLSNEFGCLKTGTRSLAAIEEEVMDENVLFLYQKQQDTPFYTVSEFIEYIKNFVKSDNSLINKTVILKNVQCYHGTTQESMDLSILYFVQNGNILVPATVRNIDMDTHIKERIDQGINWMKEFSDKGISAAELPSTEPNHYKRDYLEYIRIKDQLVCHLAYISKISKDKNRKNVFLQAIEELTDEESCEWIKYDYRTICPKHHDADNPYWRIPENMDRLKYCPYCGKKIKIVK